MIIMMIRIVTHLVDILMMAVASRLLQSAELFENGLKLLMVGLFNGYIKIKQN